jgi:hypothetical protein
MLKEGLLHLRGLGEVQLQHEELEDQGVVEVEAGVGGEPLAEGTDGLFEGGEGSLGDVRKGGREEGREEGRKGGREEGRKGGREEGRKRGREREGEGSILGSGLAGGRYNSW